MVKCQICNKEFKRITNTHLSKHHDITMAQYMAQFPESPIDTEGLANSRVSHLRGKSYEEVYGPEKGQGLKNQRKAAAKKQFEDPNQRELRKQTSSFAMAKESKKKSSKSMTKHGASVYRKRALEYYGNICERCGNEFEEKKLCVHHKDMNNLTYELGNHSVENLMVLCRPCHTKLHIELAKTTNKFVGLSHIERGVHYLFMGLKQEYGLDLTDVNFKDTPKRVARAWAEIFEGVRNTDEQVEEILGASFPSDSDEMVIVKDIRAYSMCPHHLLPVEYTIHIGYVPNGSVLGISKLSRLAEILARRPVLQEKMTTDIIKALEKLGVKGAMCIVEGIHYCMRMRGIKQANAITGTSAIYGVFNEIAARAEFISMVKK